MVEYSLSSTQSYTFGALSAAVMTFQDHGSSKQLRKNSKFYFHLKLWFVEYTHNVRGRGGVCMLIHGKCKMYTKLWHSFTGYLWSILAVN